MSNGHFDTAALREEADRIEKDADLLRCALLAPSMKEDAMRNMVKMLRAQADAQDAQKA